MEARYRLLSAVHRRSRDQERKKNKRVNWEAVATDVGDGISSAECQRLYRKIQNATSKKLNREHSQGYKKFFDIDSYNQSCIEFYALTKHTDETLFYGHECRDGYGRLEAPSVYYGHECRDGYGRLEAPSVYYGHDCRDGYGRLEAPSVYYGYDCRDGYGRLEASTDYYGNECSDGYGRLEETVDAEKKYLNEFLDGYSMLDTVKETLHGLVELHRRDLNRLFGDTEKRRKDCANFYRDLEKATNLR